jgi:heme-degrading monooxygenase HmoA
VKTLTAVDHRVADFDGWKRVYDGVREMQRSGGVRAHQVLREPGDPNRIIVTHLFDSREAADAYFASADLRAAMDAGGVDASSVKMLVFEVVDEGVL